MYAPTVIYSDYRHFNMSVSQMSLCADVRKFEQFIFFSDQVICWRNDIITTSTLTWFNFDLSMEK